MSKEKSKRSMRRGGRVWEWEVEGGGGGGGNFALRVRSSNFEVRRWNFEVRWFQLSPNFEEEKRKRKQKMKTSLEEMHSCRMRRWIVRESNSERSGHASQDQPAK